MHFSLIYYPNTLHDDVQGTNEVLLLQSAPLMDYTLNSLTEGADFDF